MHKNGLKQMEKILMYFIYMDDAMEFLRIITLTINLNGYIRKLSKVFKKHEVKADTHITKDFWAVCSKDVYNSFLYD